MRVFEKVRPKPGAAPGSLRIPTDSPPPTVEVLDFSSEQHEWIKPQTIAELGRFLNTPTTTWIDVQGLGDESVLRELADTFHIHPLALEDAANVPVRPKSEVYDHNHLVILRMARLLPDGQAERSQVTLFIGEHVLLTVQQLPGDVFDPVRRRTKSGSRMPYRGPDYVAYALIDLVIDGYYPILEPFGQRLQALEEEITTRPTRDQVTRVLQVRHELQDVRRDIVPMRDLVYQMLREESPFLEEETLTFLRDCHDHAVQIVEVVDSYVELTSQLMALHGASMSNRMNEIMKLLTIMSTIFIPLGFLAGVYGMNFERMPELGWKWAYPTLIGVMVTVVIALLFFFRRRGWLGED